MGMYVVLIARKESDLVNTLKVYSTKCPIYPVQMTAVTQHGGFVILGITYWKFSTIVSLNFKAIAIIPLLFVGSYIKGQIKCYYSYG